MNKPTPTQILTFALVGAVLFLALVGQTPGYGVTYDEILFKFPGAWRQAGWWASLSMSSLQRAQIEHAFASGSQHPSLHRTVMAWSWLLLHRGLGVDELAALRAPSALYAAIAITLLAWISYRRWGWTASVVAAGALVAHPHCWGLAHIACLDTVIAAAWLWCALAFCWAAERPGWRPAILFALVYSFALLTKVHALFIPLPLLLWALWFPPREPRKIVLATLILAPTLYVALQPGLWTDPWGRIAAQFERYIDKENYAPIAVYYLGHKYLHRPPWHYVPVLFAVSTPLVLLVLMLSGCCRALVRPQLDRLQTMLALCMATALGIFLLPKAGVYDGVRLFLPAYYTGAGLVGGAAGAAVSWLKQRFGDRQSEFGALILAAAALLPGVVCGRWLHPAELSYSNILVGGLRGAKALGFQTTYWGEVVTPDVLAVLNNTLPRNARLKTLALPEEAFSYYRLRGLIRSDIVLNAAPPYDAHLLMHRESFFNEAAGILQKQKPWMVWERDGVPYLSLYGPLEL